MDIVEKILDFSYQNQEKQGVKILTPGQILSRLPITLVQLKAGINSEELKNEIRQLLYFLYLSKKLTKKIYNNLIIIIQKMETIFMKTENSNTDKSYPFRLNLSS